MAFTVEVETMYAEFLALRTVETQLLSNVEDCMDQLPVTNVKMLIKLQKNINNILVKMIAKNSHKSSMSSSVTPNVEASPKTPVDVKAPTPELMENDLVGDVEASQAME